MTSVDLASDVIRDLLRSAWLIERARSHVYETWDMKAAAGRALQRSEIVAAALAERGRQPDEGLVQEHSAWISELVGSHPDAVPLASIFLVRIGDWVDLHAGPFLGEAEARLRDLGAEERNNLSLPSSMPAPAPFERLEIPEVDPPGPVLFSFGILADMHIGSPQGDVLVQAAIEDLNRSGVDFVIQLGDITDHGNRDEFDEALKVLSRFEMPVTTMMGNHDVYSLGEGRLSGREFYSDLFGRDPDGVLLEHKGFRFAVLDSVEHGVSPFSPFDIVSGRFVEEQAGGAIVRGALSYPQHDILADVAGPGGGPTFVFLHH
ncbi:MAG: metallophosphoesterase family protein, partial [Actinomycetota bacterium]